MSKFRLISVVLVAALLLLASLPVAANPAPVGQPAAPPSQEAPGAFLTLSLIHI